MPSPRIFYTARFSIKIQNRFSLGAKNIRPDTPRIRTISRGIGKGRFPSEKKNLSHLKLTEKPSVITIEHNEWTQETRKTRGSGIVSDSRRFRIRLFSRTSHGRRGEKEEKEEKEDSVSILGSQLLFTEPGHYYEAGEATRQLITHKQRGRRAAFAQQHFLPERPLECASWESRRPLIEAPRISSVRLSTGTRAHIRARAPRTRKYSRYTYIHAPVYIYVRIRMYTPVYIYICPNIRPMTFGTGRDGKGVQR